MLGAAGFLAPEILASAGVIPADPEAVSWGWREKKGEWRGRGRQPGGQAGREGKQCVKCTASHWA
jgi:hypothetical protein